MAEGVKVLRTDEIDTNVWEQICKGYNVCFGINTTPAVLKKSFSKSITGYTLHAMKFDKNGLLMGHNYYQPRPYILNGKKVVCALSGGTFVMPEFRKDIFIFNEMVRALDKEAAKLGWVALLGIPNENSFKYAVKVNKQKYIGDLSYYILPVHAGKIIKCDISFLNLISSFYSHSILAFNKLMAKFINNSEKRVALHLDTSNNFLDIRYDWQSYRRVKKDNKEGVYRIYNENGIKTAYINYFGEDGVRNNTSLNFVVQEILKKEDIDAILYIGTINFKQGLLTKVPKKYVPQQLPLCITLLDKKDSEIKEACSDIANIDFGLINFDVR